jgi:conjugal transfer mating pair stabilization protein TraG
MHKILSRLSFVSLLLAAGGAHAAVNTDFPVFWVAGDPNGVAHAFKGIAAFFGNGSFVGSIMAGAMTAAALVGLLIAMVSSALRTQFMVGQWFVGTVVAMAMFTPTTSITIKSFFDESSASVSPRMIVVDNVPYGIAYPAGMASYASKSISDNLMTWFTNPTDTGGAMSEGAGGLMNPLRMLSRMNSIYDCTPNRATLCNNMKSFFNACPVEAEVPAAWRDQSSLQALFDTASQNMGGYMEYKVYNAASTSGFDVTYVPCKEGGPLIYAAMIAYLDSDDYAKDLLRTESAATGGAKSLDGGETQDIAAMKTTVAEMATKLQTVLSTDQAMTNAIAANMVFGRVARAAASTSAEVDDRHAARAFAATMTEARRKAVSDQAGQASMFVSFMTQAMNAFSFLFAATAPIIVLIAMVMGVAGFKIYGSWLLFGVWSQSWLPIASLISYYVESNFWRRMEDLRHAGKLSIVGMDTLFDQLASVLYTGSTMMSAVPIITLSLISGSMVAMSSLAGKATGTDRDYVKEDRVSPDIDKAVNSGHAQAVREKMGQTFMPNSSTGARAGALDIAHSPSYKGDEGLAAAQGLAEKKAATVSATESQLSQAQASLAKTRTDKWTGSQSFEESKAFGEAMAEISKISNGFGKSDKQTAQSATGNEIGASGHAGLDLKVIGGKVTYGKKAGHSDAAAQEAVEQAQKVYDRAKERHTSDQTQSKQTWQRSNEEAIQRGEQKVDNLSAGLEKVRIESREATARAERIRSAGVGIQANTGEVLAAALNKVNPGELKEQMLARAADTVRNAGGDAEAVQSAMQNLNNAVERIPGGWKHEPAVIAGMSSVITGGDDMTKAAAWGAMSAAASSIGHSAVASSFSDYGSAIGGQARLQQEGESGIASTQIKSPDDIKAPSMTLNAPAMPGMDYAGKQSDLEKGFNKATKEFQDRPSQTITKAPPNKVPELPR